MQNQIYFRIETPEEFQVYMDKIPDYRIREEDVGLKRNIWILWKQLFLGWWDQGADHYAEEHHEGPQAEEEGTLCWSHDPKTVRVRKGNISKIFLKVKQQFMAFIGKDMILLRSLCKKY